MQLAEMVPPTPANGTGAFGLVLVPFLTHVWGWVPSVVAVVGGMLGIVWYSIMIWESAPIQSWRKTHAERRELRHTNKIAREKMERIAALRAEQSAIQAELAALDPTPMVKAAEAAAAAPAIEAPHRDSQ